MRWRFSTRGESYQRRRLVSTTCLPLESTLVPFTAQVSGLMCSLDDPHGFHRCGISSRNHFGRPFPFRPSGLAYERSGLSPPGGCSIRCRLSLQEGFHSPTSLGLRSPRGREADFFSENRSADSPSRE